MQHLPAVFLGASRSLHVRRWIFIFFRQLTTEKVSQLQLLIPERYFSINLNRTVNCNVHLCASFNYLFPNGNICISEGLHTKKKLKIGQSLMKTRVCQEGIVSPKHFNYASQNCAQYNNTHGKNPVPACGISSPQITGHVSHFYS